MKKINYNSDYMSRKQDDQLEQLEEKLTALYANAANDVKSEFTDFMQRHEKEDTRRRAEVEAGRMTEDEYTAWRKSEILRDNRYGKTVDSITTMLVNTDAAAMASVNDELPKVVAESYDFISALGSEAADKAGITAGTFQIYNANTVQQLIKDNPDLMPKPAVDIEEDKRWNKSRINREITQGIIKGESIPKISNRLMAVTKMDKNAAIRNARTAMTAAENMGRSQAAEDIKEQGVPIEEVWSATHDDRTRDSHLLLDGTTRDASGYFGVGIIATPLRYPADPAGDPEEVYNCRCRLSIQLQGIDHSKDDELYEKFMQENYPEDYEALQTNDTEVARKEAEERAKERQAELRAEMERMASAPVATSTSEELPKASELAPATGLSSGIREVVQGEDISDTWERRKDQYEFEIDDVIAAQGFNGLPQIVSEEEFNKAVEESGFIAQRTYSAPDQETLDAYQNDLYNGDWYVNCETGGAAYGQGMYVAGNTNGTMNESIEAEMAYYRDNSFGDFIQTETLTVTKDFNTIDYKEIKPEFFFREIENLYGNDPEMQAAVEKGREQRAEGVRGNPFYKDIKNLTEEKYGEEAREKLQDFFDEYIGFDSTADEGFMATLMGYDGILTHEVTPNISSKVDPNDSQHIVILNRSKVIFKGD